MNDLFVKREKSLCAYNKNPYKIIDLLSPGENFSISDHFTNFSWPIVRWYKKLLQKWQGKKEKQKFSYFFNKYGVFIPKKFLSKNHLGQSGILFLSRGTLKTRKNFSRQ